MNIRHLTTEQINSNTTALDQLSTLEIIQAINEEDQKVALTVKEQASNIADAVELIVEAFNNGGRLIYIGAGTSGRLGVLDASECLPTFGIEPGVVIGLIAGGDYALRHAIEGSEDNGEAAISDLSNINFNDKDVLVGIAASGRTPYVIAGLNYANDKGANTVSIACNQNSEISKYATVSIEAVVGPEALSGSTRMKAGTAQKMILNMLTTTSMIKLGKSYQNLMVDMVPTNEKLKQRAINLLTEATNLSEKDAHETLIKTDWQLKTAIVMVKRNCPLEEAIDALNQTAGFVGKAIQYRP